MVLAGAVLFRFDPSRSGFYPVCYFHRLTGWLCPGCGSLRALHQLLHGHLAAAFHLNPLLVLSLPLVAWFGARSAFCAWRNEPSLVSIRPAWLWCALAVLLAFGILRNLPWK